MLTRTDCLEETPNTDLTAVDHQAEPPPTLEPLWCLLFCGFVAASAASAGCLTGPELDRGPSSVPPCLTDQTDPNTTNCRLHTHMTHTPLRDWTIVVAVTHDYKHTPAVIDLFLHTVQSLEVSKRWWEHWLLNRKNTNHNKKDNSRLAAHPWCPDEQERDRPPGVCTVYGGGGMRPTHARLACSTNVLACSAHVKGRNGHRHHQPPLPFGFLCLVVATCSR